MIESEIADGVAVLRINRPEVRNALRIEDKSELITLLKRAEESGCRAVIITGVGTLAFSGGTDIREMSSFSPEDAAGMLAVERDVCDTVISLGIPVIAAVNGAAAGAGCVLAYACDLVIAAESARFGQPEIRNGVPAGLHVALLPMVVGLSRARWMLLTGEFLSASEALAAGLVNEVVPDEELMDRALAVAARISHLSPRAVTLQKRAIESYVRMPVDAAIEATLYMVASTFQASTPGEVMRGRLSREERSLASFAD